MNVLLTRILYSVTPGPAMIRAVYEYSRLILITLVNLSSYVFLWRRRSWIVTKRLPFLGMNILKISFQCSTYTKKKTLFVRKSWGITTSSKQTRSFYVRIEIKTLVILRTLFAYMSPESIRTDGCSRISILFSVILNSLLRILSHVFYSSHSAYYVWLCSFLKLKTLLSDLEA